MKTPRQMAAFMRVNTWLDDESTAQTAIITKPEYRKALTGIANNAAYIGVFNSDHGAQPEIADTMILQALFE